MRDIGSRLELFVDDWLVERMEGVCQRLHSPTPREVALILDAPWEGPESYDPVMLLNEGVYRMYYRGGGGERDRTCYAESRDGVHFQRVTVGKVVYGGSLDNNIVSDGDYGGHAVCIFRDSNPAASDSARFKATGLATRVGDTDRILALASPDGLRWTLLQNEPILVGDAEQPWFDSHSIFLWDALRGAG